jgi:hypothetical protein
MKKRYAVQGYWAGSSVHGSTQAIQELQESTVHGFQRPDATHLSEDLARTSLNGNAASIGLAKIGGSRVRFMSSASYKSPGFDINDVGFLRRADMRSMSNWIQFRDEKPSRYLRSFRFNLNQWGSWNFGGDRLDLGGNVNAHWVFANNWGTGTGVTRLARTFDDRATRAGGPGAFANPILFYWQYVSSDERKPIIFQNFVNVGGDGKGMKMRGVSPSLTFRPASFLSFSGGVDWNHTVQPSQWIANSDGRYIFGLLDQTTVSLTTRVNYTITPQLSVQIYAAPFVSAGDYGGFKQLVNGRAARYEDRYAPTTYDANPDFNVRSFRTTNVLRWEYKPGSTLFVVWQQARENDAVPGGFRVGRDVHDIFGVAPRNVFLVKLAYWVNY